jgi:NitT/TauT family transport system ATP-binding protein
MAMELNYSSILDFREVFHSYHLRKGRVDTLAGVTFGVSPGSVAALVGPSGCGKSTILRIALGLESPSSGAVEVMGSSRLGAVRSRMGAMFQEPCLLPWRTALQNVMLGLELDGLDRKSCRERALWAIDLVGLGQYAGFFPEQLSGGMQQRVALARTIVREPELLILDEPFSALDQFTREFLQDMLRGYCEKYRRAAVIVTHDLGEAAFLADRVLVLGQRPSRVIDIVENPVGTRGKCYREELVFADAVLRLRLALRLGAQGDAFGSGG